MQQSLKTTNQTWNSHDSFLFVMSSALITADFLLVALFIYKVKVQKSFEILSNRKTTSILDNLFCATFVMLVFQGIVYFTMLFISKSVTSGLICSYLSFVFHVLHMLIKFFNILTLYLFHYIWFKQRVVNFLYLKNKLYQSLKALLAIVISVSIILPFKMNIDIVFNIKDGLCRGMGFSFQHYYSIICIVVVCFIAVFLVFNQLYFLYKTNEEQAKHSNKKSIIVFGIIRKQIHSFLKLHLSVALLLVVYLVCLKLLHYDGLVKFADAKYLVLHLYNFCFTLILCFFRLNVSKLDIRDIFLKIKNTFSTD